MAKYKIAMVYLNKDHNVGQGVGSIASVILHKGHHLKFFDVAYEEIEDITEDILSGFYNFLFISSITMFYKIAVKLAMNIKLGNKNIRILLGGIHATLIGADVLKSCQYIDYICIGEGEDFVIDFLDKFGTTEFTSIENLGYRDDNGDVHTNSVRPCTDLKTLHTFKWDLFRTSSVVNAGPLPGFCYVFATRGCPFSCSYCCNQAWLNLYHKKYLRRREIDVVIQELKYLKNNYPVQTFYFADEMILFNLPYVEELLWRVHKEIQLPYGCMSRVEKITPEVIDLFKKTGCVYVGMGIECGNEKFRKDFLNRQMTNDQIIYAFDELRKVPGLKTSSYNMKGFPVEYDDQLTSETLALNDRIKPDFVGMSFFYPFPGTKLYDYCIENDKIDPVKFDTATDYYTVSVLRD